MISCVFQVTQALLATGGMAGTASEALLGWQEFLVCQAPRALLVFPVSASQPPAPCRLGSGPSAKGQFSERLSAAWLSADAAPGKGAGRRNTTEAGASDDSVLPSTLLQESYLTIWFRTMVLFHKASFLSLGGETAESSVQTNKTSL